jgi:peptidoglycan/xylan/chitin deacetylase (PgdA/CDA1 family)
MNKSILLLIALFSISANLSAGFVTKLKPGPGMVALTFDDGPDPRYTPIVLSILARNHIKATFFIVGSMAKAHPGLVLDIQRAGHVIANHTYHHPSLRSMSAARIDEEIMVTNQVLRGITGETPKCLRPPYGNVNQKVRDIANKEGLRVVTWDWNSLDYTKETPETEARNILAHTGAGSVVLMHDANRGGMHTAEALPAVIEGYVKRGIGFDTICD